MFFQDSSVPGGVFVWSIENSGNDSLHVSITFTMKNGTGSKKDKKGIRFSISVIKELMII